MEVKLQVFQIVSVLSPVALLIAGFLFEGYRRTLSKTQVTLNEIKSEMVKHNGTTKTIREDRVELTTTLNRLLEFMIRQDERATGD